MNYPAEQEAEAIACWRRAVEASRPGCLNGWEHDLPLHLDYKRAQSVYTDVIRAALGLAGEQSSSTACLAAAEKIRPVLARAEEALGLPHVPDLEDVARVMRTWCATTPEPPPGRPARPGKAAEAAGPGGAGESARTGKIAETC
jgi:hypothetical protein